MLPSPFENVEPEDNPIYAEYYTKRDQEVPEDFNGVTVKPFVKSVEDQTEENFTRTKTTLRDIDASNKQMQSDIKELGYVEQILQDKKLPADFMTRSKEDLSKLRADEFLEYIDQKNAIQVEAERMYYEE